MKVRLLLYVGFLFILSSANGQNKSKPFSDLPRSEKYLITPNTAWSSENALKTNPKVWLDYEDLKNYKGLNRDRKISDWGNNDFVINYPVNVLEIGPPKTPCGFLFFKPSVTIESSSFTTLFNSIKNILISNKFSITDYSDSEPFFEAFSNMSQTKKERLCIWIERDFNNPTNRFKVFIRTEIHEKQFGSLDFRAIDVGGQIGGVIVPSSIVIQKIRDLKK